MAGRLFKNFELYGQRARCNAVHPAEIGRRKLDLTRTGLNFSHKPDQVAPWFYNASFGHTGSDHVIPLFVAI